MFSRQVKLPLSLLSHEGFLRMPKAQRDSISLYCFCMLMKGCARKFKKAGPTDCVPVGYEFLTTHLRRSAIKRARDWLIKNGFIEIDGVFRFRNPERKKSLGHRFTQLFLHSEFVPHELETVRAQRRIEKASTIRHQSQSKSRRIKGVPSDTHQTLFDLMHLLDLPEAEMLREVNGSPPNKFASRLNRGLEFCRKNFWATVSPNGRFYTSLTNLWKAHRNLLTAKGEPLCEIDISACQPLCLSLIAEQHISTDECVRFRELCESRRLYVVIREVTGLTIEEAKIEILAFLCGRNRTPKSLARIREAEEREDTSVLSPVEKIHSWFRQAFPEFSVFLSEWKSSKESREKMRRLKRARGTTKRTDPHRIASNEMQSMEAEIIIQGVCAEYIKKFPGEFIAPIHDAILIPDRMRSHVIEIIYQAVSDKRLQPQIKITGPDQQSERIHLSLRD